MPVSSDTAKSTAAERMVLSMEGVNRNSNFMIRFYCVFLSDDTSAFRRDSKTKVLVLPWKKFRFGTNSV